MNNKTKIIIGVIVALIILRGCERRSEVKEAAYHAKYSQPQNQNQEDPFAAEIEMLKAVRDQQQWQERQPPPRQYLWECQTCGGKQRRPEQPWHCGYGSVLLR